MRLSILSLIITAIILYLAFHFLDFERMVAVAQSIDGYYVGLALLVWVFIIVGKSFKWQTVVSALDGSISLLLSMKTLLIGLFIGVVTPGRIGDFVRVFYLQKKMGTGRGIMAVLVDRILDVSILLLLSIGGVTLLLFSKGFEVLSIPLLGIVVFTFIVGVYSVLNRRIAGRFWKMAHRFIPISFREIILIHGKEFYDSVPVLRKNGVRIGWAFGWGLFSWLFTITMGFFLLQAAHISIGWEAALIVVPVISLIEIIPFGIAGVGTRELAAAGVLSVYSVPLESAVIFSFTYFIVGYLPSFVAGIILFIQEPPHFRSTLFHVLDRFRGTKE